MEDEIECVKCGWCGSYSELICNPEDLDKPVKESRFDVCPGCDQVSDFDDLDIEED